MSEEDKKPGRRSEPRVWLYTEHWLWGSTRSELTLEERAVFVDILCLGITGMGKVDITHPDQVADQLIVPRDVFKSCIDKGIKTGKFIIKNFKRHLADFKTYLIILNWERYQPEYLHDRPEKPTKKARSDKGGKHAAHVAPIEDSIVGDNIVRDSSSNGEAHFDTQFEFLNRLRILEEDFGVEHEDEKNKQLYAYLLKEHPHLDPVRELDAIIDLWKKNPGEVRKRLAAGKSIQDQLYALFNKSAEYLGVK